MAAKENLLDKINKKYGNVAYSVAKAPNMEIERIPTGIPMLDVVLNGGLPKGRVTVLSGEFSTFKSSVALLACAEVVRSGGVAYYIDLEGGLAAEYLDLAGIPRNSENFIVVNGELTAEAALDIVCDVVDSGQADLVVLDSVSALASEAEMKGETGDAIIGQRARYLTKTLRKCSQTAKTTGCSSIFITQFRANIGAFGHQDTKMMDGPRALGYFSSTTLEFARFKQLTDSDKVVVGHMIQVKVAKARTSRPFVKTMFTHSYVNGIDRLGSVLDCAIELGRVKTKGSWYYLDGEQLGAGRAKASAYFGDNPDVAAEIVEQYRVEFNKLASLDEVDDIVDVDSEEVSEVE